MKTILLPLVLTLAAAPAAAQELLLKNLKFGGEIDLQTTAGGNIKDFATHPRTGNAENDRVGSAQTLVLLRADWDVLDDVHARVALSKNDRDWGTIGGNTHGNSQSQPLGTSGNNILGSTFVDEAYVKIDKVFGAVDSTFGRQFYGSQGDIGVYYGPRIGLLGMPVTALDAARFDWTDETTALTGVVGKITGTAAANVDQADVDLRGLLGTYRFDENTSATAYVYDSVTHATGGSGVPGTTAGTTGLNTNLWLAGLKAKLGWGPFLARAEFAKNLGEDRTGAVTSAGSTYTGWAVKADLGVRGDFEDVGTAGLWAQFAEGSGQGDKTSRHNNLFTPIAGDYRGGDIYTRFNSLAAVALDGTDAVTGGFGSSSLGNRVIWGAGFKGTPAAATKLTVTAGYWDYRQQTTPLTANFAQPALNGNKHLGSEADLDLDWKHSENVSFDAGTGKFFPGGVVYETHRLTSGLGVNPAWAAWFDVHILF